jgi:hypothetical protein
MPTVNFRLTSDSDSGAADPDLVVNGVDLTALPGVSQFDRLIIVTLAMSATAGVPPGPYEHTGEDSAGNWTYSPCQRA